MTGDLGRICPHIVGVVGLAGSGKTTLAEMLEREHGYNRVYFGAHVLQEVQRRALPPSEASERNVREDLRRQFGMAAMAILSEQEIRDRLAHSSNVVIDGLYSLAELLFLRNQFPIAVVAIHASSRVRRERIAGRANRPLAASELHQRDLAEIKGLDKATPIALADYHVLADGSERDLLHSVRRVVGMIREDFDCASDGSAE